MRDQKRSLRKEELEKLDKSMQKMKEESAEFFSNLGISGEELHQFVENEENFSPTEWQYMIEQRKKLEETLERRIDQENRKKDVPSPFEAKVKGHWIFMK